MNLFRLVLIAVFLAALTFSSCEKAAPTEGEIDTGQKEIDAYIELENQLYALSTATIRGTTDLDQISFARANALYKEVLAANPNHTVANFGAALTEIFGAYADTSINGVIKRWEQYINQGSVSNPLPGTNLFRFHLPTGLSDMKLPAPALATNLSHMLFKTLIDPPTITEMQTVLKNNFLPRLEYALARLTIVEQSTAFELKVSGKMQGDPNLAPVYLDLTEVYVIDAMIRSIKAGVDQFLVYQYPLASYTTAAVVAALQPSNAFFTLAPDGATRAAGIRTNLIELTERLRSGINYLKAETDNQNDDIIKAGPGGVSAVDLDSLYSYLGQAETWLSTTQTVELRNADTDGNNYTIQVSLKAFFDNPPSNPKQQWLPPYTVDTSSTGDIVWRWTQQDYATFAFPDPTFGGILPGMTNNTLKRLMYIDEEFAWRIEVSVVDDNYGLGPGTVITLTAASQTYQPKPRWTYGWSGYWSVTFLILDNNNATAQINVTNNGVSIPIQLDRQLTVQLKSRQYGTIDITQARQDITGFGSGPTPAYVSLNLVAYAYYKIERRTTSTFAVIDSVMTSFYTDYGVASGTTYQYRAKREGSWWWWGDFRGFRTNNYTNMVTVSVP